MGRSRATSRSRSRSSGRDPKGSGCPPARQPGPVAEIALSTTSFMNIGGARRVLVSDLSHQFVDGNWPKRARPSPTASGWFERRQSSPRRGGARPPTRAGVGLAMPLPSPQRYFDHPDSPIRERADGHRAGRSAGGRVSGRRRVGAMPAAGGGRASGAQFAHLGTSRQTCPPVASELCCSIPSMTIG